MTLCNFLWFCATLWVCQTFEFVLKLHKKAFPIHRLPIDPITQHDIFTFEYSLTQPKDPTRLKTIDHGPTDQKFSPKPVTCKHGKSRHYRFRVLSFCLGFHVDFSDLVKHAGLISSSSHTSQREFGRYRFRCPRTGMGSMEKSHTQKSKKKRTIQLPVDIRNIGLCPIRFCFEHMEPVSIDLECDYIEHF